MGKLDMNEPNSSETNNNQFDSSTKKRPSAFAWGLALGISMGVFAATIVAVVAMVVANPLGTMMKAQRFFGRDPSSVEYVEASDPWLKMVDKKHGRLTGFTGGGGSSGDGMPHGAISQFDLVKPTQQNGIRASITIPVYVTPKTKLTRGGKPWKLKGQNAKSPANAVFNGLEPDPNDSFLEFREITVYFRLEGRDLVAERIDTSKQQKDRPSWMQ